MKAIRLLLAVMVLSTTAAMARDHKAHANKSPEVIVIGGNEATPDVYEYNTPEEVKAHVRAKHKADHKIKATAIEQIKEGSHVDESKGTEAPIMVVTQKNNKFAFAIGGFINLRSSYDFKGVAQNIDFIPSLIPVPGNYASRQQFMMDATTSRIYFQGVANSRALGEIEIYVDMDFRGGAGYNDEGVVMPYRPRVRRAYASLMGFTIGRDYTTFADISAIPTTIDFQGPNAAAFNYATLLRYNYNCCEDRLGFALALEQPSVSGTYGANGEFAPIPQRVPDGIGYIEYKMGENRQHHLRASGVVRGMYAYNTTTENNTSLVGWGAQLSGNVMPAKWMNIMFSGTYGEGISPYIQDLIGMGLDFTPNPEKVTSLQTMPMYGAQVAASINLTKRLMVTGGYSSVRIRMHNGYYTDDQYKRCDFSFGNLFYDVTPRFKVACEYINGYHQEMDGDGNSANRASLMAQFSF